tara:strand:- start:1888 stop:2892 length:1005 start_codon:yes stop_codon:yes gene_type:complete
MNLLKYDFNLPKDQIANRPKKPRGSSKLLVVEKKTGKITSTTFDKIVDYFSPKDLFIFNNTKVAPLSLILKDDKDKERKILLVEELEKDIWKVLTKRPQPQNFNLSNGLSCKLYKNHEDNNWLIKFNQDSQLFIDKYGMMPIPPYLNREADAADFIDYQTIYAKVPGSIAAPTAGLHFNQSILSKIKEKEIDTKFLTLHVGMGTFIPIKVKEVEKHKMHKEKFFIESDLIKNINDVRSAGGRTLSVGTTTLRALEGSNLYGKKYDQWFETDIFITEGFDFALTDSLLTNFHLPKSTLLVLISSFLGYELTKLSYEFAIKEKFNFYSYGDAMLII